MSDLRYQTSDELRRRIASCESSRAKIYARKKEIIKQIKELEKENLDLGRKAANIGQIECWARIYLAQKT